MHDNTRKTIGAALAFLLTPTCLSAQTGDDFDEAAARKRLKLIELGSYQIKQAGQAPVSPSDVELCMRAARVDDVEMMSRACSCLGSLSGEDFFAKIERKKLDGIVELVIGHLGSEYDEVAKAACRTIQRFDAYHRWTQVQFTTGDLPLSKQMLRKTHSRRIATLAMAWAANADPAVHARAGRLLWAVADNLGPQVNSEIARVLLTAIEKHSADAAEVKKRRRRRAVDSLKSALAVAIPGDPKIISEMVRLFLVDARTLEADHWSVYSKANALRALGRCGPQLEGKLRAEVLALLVTQVKDPKLSFMTTSGIRSPYHHHGTQAVARMIPALSAEELKLVEAALAELRAIVKRSKGSFTAADAKWMFHDADEALAARRLSGSKAQSRKTR